MIIQQIRLVTGATRISQHIRVIMVQYGTK